MKTFYGGGYMFRNLEAEQRRAGMTNTDVAEYLGVSRATYENKKKDGKFTRPEIVKLLRLFNCKFEYGRYTIHRRGFQGRQESRPSILHISARRARPRNKTYMARQGPRKRTYRHYGLCHSARPHNREGAYFCTRTAAILAGVGVFGDGRLYHDQGGPPHYKLSRLLLTHGQRRNQCEIAHRRSIAGRE